MNGFAIYWTAFKSSNYFTPAVFAFALVLILLAWKNGLESLVGE